MPPCKEAVGRYETLRTSRRRNQEYDLFLCQGLIGWISLYTRSMPTKSVTYADRKTGEYKGKQTEVMPEVLQSNIVNVLTGITMAVYRSANDDQQTC